jgi:hypothetical protein
LRRRNDFCKVITPPQKTSRAAAGSAQYTRLDRRRFHFSPFHKSSFSVNVSLIFLHNFVRGTLFDIFTFEINFDCLKISFQKSIIPF